VLQTIHLAGGGMSNLQPETLVQVKPGHYRLAGNYSHWVHPQHFRPGSPKIPMEWNWKHEMDIAVKEGAIDLSLRSTAGRSLIASLIFWFRPGVEVFEGDRSLGTLAAGQKMALTGGTTVSLNQGHCEMKIAGLPTAAHRRFIGNAPAIPSKITSQCGALYLGLTFPINLSIQLLLK
jgi:hypothetical protein